MTLASSGSINMVGPDTTPRRSIGVELGDGTLVKPVSLLSTAVFNLTGRSGGPITMPGDFYGRSTDFIFNDVIPSSTIVANYNLRTRAIAAGWDEVRRLIATTTLTDSSTYVYADTVTLPAMSAGAGTFPGGSTWSIINNGYIIGYGGAGGAGGTVSGSTLTPGSAGGHGGPALYLHGNISVTLTNNNAIGSGGGGGGGGGAARYVSGKGKSAVTYGFGGGGGGGGSGGLPGLGGAVGPTGGAGGGAAGNTNNYPGTSGGSGNGVGGGIAGVGGYFNSSFYGGNQSGGDGYGGSWGSDGIPGSAGRAVGGTTSAGGAGGTAGYAIYGLAYVTILVTGFITGRQA